MQSPGLVLPVWVGFIYFPGGQGLQLVELLAPTAEEYLADGQSVHAWIIERRFAGNVSIFPNFPPVHNLQRVASVAALAYLPTTHLSH